MKIDNDDNDNQEYESYKLMGKLKSLMNALFKMKLASNDEPLLLSGPTGYKTYISKKILYDPDVVALNQESTISQLLGSSFFYSNLEDKKFCLKYIYLILKEENLEIDLEKVNDWEKNKKYFEDKINYNIYQKYEDEDEKDIFYNILVNLKNKLFSESEINENSLIKMKLEFKPGLILNAIISQKSLILKDMPKVKTIVLERFNELFSGQHNLTLIEDIPNTFTSKNKKELKDFNKDFRIIATCKTGEEKNLSEALLSRFTVISIQPYTEKEEQEVLKITAVKNQDIDEIKKLTTTKLTLTEAKNCLEICKSLDLLLKNQHENNLKLALFMWYKGNIERREKRINDIKEQFKSNINDYEIGK